MTALLVDLRVRAASPSLCECPPTELMPPYATSSNPPAQLMLRHNHGQGTRP